MKRKIPRDEILWARIKKVNHAFIHAKMKELGYKSVSEFVDDHFDSLRIKRSDRKAG